VVIGIGTRFTDFTTMSKTAFGNPDVRFVTINVCEFDAFKHAAIPVVADARVALEELTTLARGYQTSSDYRSAVAARTRAWRAEVDAMYSGRGSAPFAQAEIIGALNAFTKPEDVVVCAAGSLPGDLHKLWRARQPNTYHLEYGYSCMGYEIAGGLGIKMAAPDREVYVMVGDGSYLMMAQEIVTAVSENIKLIVVIVQNHGYASIGELSEKLGSQRFGTYYRYRNPQTGLLDGDKLPIDLAANAESLGADVIRVQTIGEFREALARAKQNERTTAVHIETDPVAPIPSSGGWWDVPVSEVAQLDSTQQARKNYEANKANQRPHITPAEQ
jgi:3D-(3,5/4)-trihydroxycyclohexane-1,2-dione acylhydrolase (decyclizing)